MNLHHETSAEEKKPTQLQNDPIPPRSSGSEKREIVWEQLEDSDGQFCFPFTYEQVSPYEFDWEVYAAGDLRDVIDTINRP